MKRLELSITGRVQGVGFRPFLFKLAQKYGLTGIVYNTSGGVCLQIQGERGELRAFFKALRAGQPPQAKIQRITGKTLPNCPAETEFVIAASRATEAVAAVLPPDLATCEQCRREIFSLTDRRYRYPFTNCTDCGPRFSIVEALPYDRPVTTMAGFQMCDRCGREYRQPTDRRFHAQPNACPQCGPRLYLLETESSTGAVRRSELSDPLQAAVAALKNGQPIIIKGLGGFHLAADATCRPAVAQIRRLKKRAAKPLAVMCRDLDQAAAFCEVTASETALLTAASRPIVILRQARAPQIRLADLVAPGQDSVGVMLPYTPLHYLIMDSLKFPLVMTSANRGDQPIPIDETEIAPELLQGVALVLSHNRPIAARCDDSVVLAAPEPIMLRRSRGYVPETLRIPAFGQALGIGADYKNTACYIRGQEAYFTPHIGNLDDEPAKVAAARSLEHLSKLFDLRPEVIGCDLHPEYRSREFAATFGLPLVAVQHHHAHILSCMAEHRLPGPVLGVAFDGTGYGTDGTVWGGEFLVAEYHAFTRVGSLRAVGMPGGARAVREPWRMALSYLYETFGTAIPDFPGLDRLADQGGDLLLPLMRQRLNNPVTTSAGRFFDAVAALLGLAVQADYEGEAAMRLEGVARRSFAPDWLPYPITVTGPELIRLDWRETIRSLVADLSAGRPSGELAGRFHLTVAHGILKVCIGLRAQTGLDQVALSGGVFQNALLLAETRKLLERDGFFVYTQRQVPPNDGGIALGQAVNAAAATL